MANVGPQYQSQLALLAGALGHGLDPQQGFSIYQDTLQQAAQARAARQAAIQQTLASVGQIAQDQATAGASPKATEALVNSATAALPYSGTHKVQHGVNQILGALDNYKPPVDPMAQAQLQGQLIQNQADAAALQAGTTLDPGSEDVYGAAHVQLVQQLTEQGLARGWSPPEIRAFVLKQVVPQLAPATTVTKPATTADGTPIPGQTQKVTAPGPAAGVISAAINHDITATLIHADPSLAANYPNFDPTAAAAAPPAAPTTGAASVTGADVMGALNTAGQSGFGTGGFWQGSPWTALTGPAGVWSAGYTQAQGNQLPAKPPAASGVASGIASLLGRLF